MPSPTTPSSSPPSAHYGRLGHDVSRPRRPNPDDVSYLLSLPLSPDPSDPDSVLTSSRAARAGLTSLGPSLASVSGDARGSSLLESCVRLGLSLPPGGEEDDVRDVRDCLEAVLTSAAPYAEFLAINRYGSHVLQAVLERCPEILGMEKEGEAPSKSAGKVLEMADVAKDSLLEMMQVREGRGSRGGPANENERGTKLRPSNDGALAGGQEGAWLTRSQANRDGEE